jgi:hypothetical protein
MIIVNTAWDDFLFQQIAECRQNIRIATPGLSSGHVQQILDAKRKEVSLEVATGFGIKEFYFGKTDLDAVEKLVENKDTITGVPGLEALFAVFDNERSYVSSGGLVAEGPGSTKSYNVLIDNPYISKQLSTDFDMLIKSEPAHLFSINVIQEYREIIRQLKNNEKGQKTSQTNTSTPFEVLDSLDLRGWTLDVLEVVLKMKNSTFRLSEVYEYVEKLQTAHPLNNHVQAKIRQQLQVLRDLKLLDFLDQRGTYRKRWPLV